MGESRFINNVLVAGNRFSDSHLVNLSIVYDFDDAYALKIYYGWGNLTNTGEKWKPTVYMNIENKYINIPSGLQTYPSKIALVGNGTSLSQLYANLLNANTAFNSSKLLFNIWKNGCIDLARKLPCSIYKNFIVNYINYHIDKKLIRSKSTNYEKSN